MEKDNSEKENTDKGLFQKGKIWKRTIVNRDSLKQENSKRGIMKKDTSGKDISANDKYEKENSEKNNSEKETINTIVPGWSNMVNKSDLGPVNKSDLGSINTVNKTDLDGQLAQQSPSQGEEGDSDTHFTMPRQGMTTAKAQILKFLLCRCSLLYTD